MKKKLIAILILAAVTAALIAADKTMERDYARNGYTVSKGYSLFIPDDVLRDFMFNPRYPNKAGEEVQISLAGNFKSGARAAAGRDRVAYKNPAYDVECIPRDNGFDLKIRNNKNVHEKFTMGLKFGDNLPCRQGDQSYVFKGENKNELFRVETISRYDDGREVKNDGYTRPGMGRGGSIYETYFEKGMAEKVISISDISKSKKIYVVGEVKEKATEYSKTYALSDGSYKVVNSLTMENGRTKNKLKYYKDEAGNYRDVAISLVDGKGISTRGVRHISGSSAGELAWTAGKSSPKKAEKEEQYWHSLSTPAYIKVPKKFNSGYKMAYDNKSLEFVPVGSANAAGEINGKKDTVNYSNVWNKTDVSLEVKDDGIKETIIARAPGAPAVYTYKVMGELSNDLMAGKMGIEPAYLADAGGRKRNVKQRLRRQRDGTYLDLMVDYTGLKYPVRIDPTVSTQTHYYGDEYHPYETGKVYLPPNAVNMSWDYDIYIRPSCPDGPWGEDGPIELQGGQVFALHLNDEGWGWWDGKVVFFPNDKAKRDFLYTPLPDSDLGGGLCGRWQGSFDSSNSGLRIGWNYFDTATYTIEWLDCDPSEAERVDININIYYNTIERLELTPKEPTISVGEVKNMKATLYYDALPSKDVTKLSKTHWVSLDKDVATAKDGKVTGISKGTARIRASYNNGTYRDENHVEQVAWISDSTIVTVDDDDGKIPAPNVDVTNITNTTATVTWDTSPYPPGTTYRIILDGNLLDDDNTGSTFPLSGLQPGSTYTVEVIACVPEGQCSAPGSDTFTTTGGSGGGGEGGGGSGGGSVNTTLVFSPATSSDIPGNNNGWVNQNINVTVTASGDRIITKTQTVNWSWSESPDEVYSGVSTYTQKWILGPITITGSASGTGSVILTQESGSLWLTATAKWLTAGGSWDAPPDSQANVPTPVFGNPPDVTATSGIYKIDKTVPTGSIIWVRDGFKQQHVNITYTDPTYNSADGQVSGVGEMNILKPDGSWTGWRAVSTSASDVKFSNYTTNQTVQIQFRDKAGTGNISTGVIYDTRAVPSITGTNLAGTGPGSPSNRFLHTAPGFSWMYWTDTHNDPGNVQYGYDILYSTRTGAMFFDTGMVITPATSFIYPKASTPTAASVWWNSGTWQYRWLLKIWDMWGLETTRQGQDFEIIALERLRVTKIGTPPNGQTSPVINNPATHIMIDYSTNPLPKIKANGMLVIMFDSIGPVNAVPLGGNIYYLNSTTWDKTTATAHNFTCRYPWGSATNRFSFEIWSRPEVVIAGNNTLITAMLQGVTSEGNHAYLRANSPYDINIAQVLSTAYTDWNVILKGRKP